MSFVRHFSQVFQFNLKAYIDSRSPKGFVAQQMNLVTNSATKFAGYNSAEHTLPVCRELVSEASALTAEKLPAFILKIGDYADQWIKSSWGESSSAHYLFSMISYVKLKEQATPHDPSVHEFKLAREKLVASIQQTSKSAEEKGKKLAYLGQLTKDEKSPHYVKPADARNYFPETSPGKIAGSFMPYRHYTYLNDALKKEKYDKKELPPIDEKLPLELQDNYAWFHLEGKYSIEETVRRLEVDAHIDGTAELLKMLNEAQEALAKLTAELAKFTDPLADQKALDKAPGKLSLEFAALVSQHQKLNHEKDVRYAAALAELEKKYDAAIAVNRQRLAELEKIAAEKSNTGNAPSASDAKLLEKIRTITAEKQLSDEALVKLQTELAAQAKKPSEQPAAQPKKEDAAAKPDDKLMAELASLRVQLKEAQQPKPLDVATAQTLRAEGAAAEAKKHEAIVAALKAQHATALKAKTVDEATAQKLRAEGAEAEAKKHEAIIAALQTDHAKALGAKDKLIASLIERLKSAGADAKYAKGVVSNNHTSMYGKVKKDSPSTTASAEATVVTAATAKPTNPPASPKTP